MPDVYGQPYEAIPADRVFAYSESNPPPNCDDGGQTQAPYDEVAGNAFYCSNGDFVAYDEQGLLPKLRENFGEFAVGLVFAHELGHAVQARVGYDPSATVYLEQQADCFAGAWAQHVAEQRRRERAPLRRRPRQRARRSADPERPVGHRRRPGGRARQRLRPGRRVPGRVRGRRARRARRTRASRPTSPRPATRATRTRRAAATSPSTRWLPTDHQEPGRVLDVAVVEAHRTDGLRRQTTSTAST